jgi:hypothetical protein
VDAGAQRAAHGAVHAGFGESLGHGDMRRVAARLDHAGRPSPKHTLGVVATAHAHILLAPRTVNLIDFALAQGPYPLQPDVTYRGGMVHFTAPEIAAHLLATSNDETVTIGERAEVYALAAVLHVAWTGLPPTAYNHHQEPLQDKLKDVA